jgi:hypothetical protein
MLHGDLEETLSAAFSGSDSMAAITAGMCLFPDASSAADLLAAVLCSPGLPALAAASYEHPNGFAKLVLAGGAGRFKLRLHVWPAAGGRPSDLHDHRWDFGSRVLLGGYRFEEHVPVPGDTFHCYHYRSPGGEDSFAIEHAGRTGTRLAHEGRAVAGHEYTLKSDVIHRVFPSSAGPTITLVLQGPTVRSFTSVLSEQPKGLPASLQVPIVRLTAERYRAMLLTVRALLAPPARTRPGHAEAGTARRAA